MTVVRILRTEDCDPDLPLPSYESDGAAGADIRANLPNGGERIEAGHRILIKTGLRFEIERGFEVQVRPRSGLALKQGITLVNTPGTIDADYRGEVGIILINHGQDDVTISHGDRIAQIVVAPVTQATFEEVDTLTATSRGEGGFGSTGVST